ncbi:MAG: CocE/NonD family hydrolase [Neisseriales bacterium]|nr:MAG: CocE/NonD family hydrolase [Neisseriales bacterium]
MAKLTKNSVTKQSTVTQKLAKLKALIKPPLTIHKLSPEIEVLRDVRVVMRDGVTLSLNIYKPKISGKFPTLLNLHPYCKDNLPQKGKVPFQYRVIRQTGQIAFSEETSWEAPDPDFWVKQGYVIVNIDKRGFGKSDDAQEMLDDAEAQDYYDVIEWSAAQEWSSGKIALFGVSYLAISQYKVAALNPPHLSAICPWEGFSDAYKDAFRPGGIREDGFILMWSHGVKKKSGPVFRDQQCQHTLRDDFYLSMVPDLHKIKVPALICASFSDHQLHTRGSFRAFEQIASQQKWLYTHRTGKWASFYSEQAKALQLKFFDYFLKGIQNDMPSHPKVTVEVRESRDNVYKIRYEHQWPIVDTQWTKLCLNHEQSILSDKDDYGNTEFESFLTTTESLKFSYIFPQDTGVTGPMKLTLFVSLENIDDANLFIGIQKFHNGEEVNFEGSYGFANDVVSKGFMKISLSEINGKDSLFYQPEHDFNRQKAIASGEIIQVEISLLPSATLFRQDDELRLVIQGVPLLKYGKFHQIGEYEKSAAGKCYVWSSNRYPSALLIPIVR